MNINYSSKLFYCKYAYKVVLRTTMQGCRWWRKPDPIEFSEVTEWCEQHAPGAHKILRRFQTSDNNTSDWHQLVYVQTESVKNAIVQEFGAQVFQVWQPLNQEHFQNLEVRNITEVRAQLIWKKYSHVIYFKYDRHHTVYTWLQGVLADAAQSQLKGTHWWPRVYSSDVGDVQMIQLSYPEKIDYIKQVVLLPP
jgi:hypothetical protein